ncbi:PAS domain S-box protein [Methylobacterium phyllosphaerae]
MLSPVAPPSPDTETTRLQAVLDGLQDGFYSLDNDWCFVEINRYAEHHLGLDRLTATGLPIWEALPELVGSEIEARFRQIRASGEPAIFEAPSAVHPSHIIEFNLFPLGSGLGVSFRDVTRARQAEADLRESRARLELATEAADLGIWDWNLQTGEMLYSERAKVIHGFAPGEPVTLGMIRDATHHDDLPRTSAMAQSALDPAIREHAPYEYRIIRPSDGAVRWMLAHGEAVYASVDGEERAIRYVGTLQDITGHHSLVEALRGSEVRLHLALEAAHMAVWVYDLANNSFLGSPELNRLYGFAADAQVGLEEFQARYYPGDRERVVRAHQDSARSGERYFEVEYRCTQPDQSVRWLLLRAENETDAAGQPTRIIGVVLDITRRKRLEEQQALVTRELHHRVKNTLATVQALVSSTARHARTMAEFQQSVTDRIASLAKTHTLLIEDTWGGADLRAILLAELSPYDDGTGRRVRLEGPDVHLPSEMALALSMTAHELTTNAVKYGAFSLLTGRVEVTWSLETDETGERRLTLTWAEHDGPVVEAPARQGFGSVLLQRVLGRQLGGEVETTYAPEGLRVRISALLRQS